MAHKNDIHIDGISLKLEGKRPVKFRLAPETEAVIKRVSQKLRKAQPKEKITDDAIFLFTFQVMEKKLDEQIGK